MKHIIILICLIQLASCNLSECENQVSGRYQFEIPVSIEPATDRFRIGDTIFIESIFSKEVFERQTQKNFTLEDFYFYPATLVLQLDTFPASPYALEYFDHQICAICDDYSETISSTSRNIEGQYYYDGENYFLKLALIPKKAGLFMLRQYTSLYPAGERQTFPGQCGKSNISSIMNVNEGADNNRALIYESKDSSMIVWVENGSGDRYADSGNYCFYVVE
jgi:hypothetical protein